MSGAAEETRRHLLKASADRAVRRAEKLHALIEEIYDNGDEPLPGMVAEFENACRRAEVLLLEAAIANMTGSEPEVRP